VDEYGNSYKHIFQAKNTYIAYRNIRTKKKKAPKKGPSKRGKVVRD